MLRNTLIIAFALGLGACGQNDANIIHESTLSVGPYKVGQTEAEVKAIDNTVTFAVHDGADDCSEAATKNPNVILLMQEGVVKRITIRNMAYVSEKNLRVGDAEDVVMQKYDGKLDAKQHLYDDIGQYLSQVDANGRGVMYETMQGKLFAIHLGVEPQLFYAEGCS